MTARRDADHRGPASTRLAVCGVLAAFTLTGCAAGGSTAGQGSPTPRADLAAQAEVAARNVKQHPAGAKASSGKAKGTATSGSGRAGRKRTPGPGRSATGPAGGSGPAGTATASWTPVRLATDARGDHGRGPSYADLTSLALEDDGTHLRLTVELGGTVPGRLADGEVQGIGVDLYRASGQESDFQVFLDGGAHGWRGYLQTPRGFVKYVGTLGVDGRTLVSVIPWSALDGRQDAQVSAFSDWSSGHGGSSADTVDPGPMQVG